MATELTIDDLPDEVIEFIFSKLTLPALKTVRLVCKHWLQVSNVLSITRHELIKIELKDLYRYRTPRGCYNIEILNQDPLFTDFEQQEEFWNVHGSSMRSIKVITVGIFSPIVNLIINHCCNVKELKLKFSSGLPNTNIDDVDSVIVEGAQLNCLESLTLTCMPSAFVAGPAFSRLTECVPNLKRLVLNSFVEQNSVSMSHILLLIRKQAFTLTEIILRNISCITDSFLDCVLKVIGPQLTGLYLVYLHLESFDCLTNNADKLPNLKHLELTEMRWGRFRDNSMSELLRFKNLEFISTFQTFFSHDDILPFVPLKNLKGLDISNILAECTANGILRYFGEKTLTNLTVLKMEHLACVTDDVLATILPNLPNLKCLDLAGCRQITPVGASAIYTNCKQLTHLVLSGCPAIHTISHDLPKLKFLDLWDCNVTLEGLQQIVTHCQQLTQLSIGTCFTMDKVEPAIFSSLKHLAYLKLSYCFDLIAINPDYDNCVPDAWFTELFINCPQLKFVRFGSVVFQQDYGRAMRLSGPIRRNPFHFTIFEFSK